MTHYKTVSLDQLLSLLDRSVVVEQLKKPDVRIVTIPQLPERTIFVDTTETSKSLDITLTGWIPGLEYPFLYQDESYLVKIPTMVYQVVWGKRKKKIKSLRLAVTTHETVTVESPLYRWPFSNVYSSGGVCWNVEAVQCDLHQVVERAVFGFLQTPNNRDLFGVGTSQNSAHRDYGEFLRAVKSSGQVPEEWLIPLQQNIAEFHANGNRR